MPRSLDLDRLRQFEPEPARPVAAPRTDMETAVPIHAEDLRDPEPRRWPSREPIRDGQVSIKASLDVIDRFRTMCRDDRRTYADMLGILMDGHEGRR